MSIASILRVRGTTIVQMVYSETNLDGLAPLSTASRDYLEKWLVEPIVNNPKRLLWECANAHSCDRKNCEHRDPHEFIEDDCDGGMCGFRNMKVAPCHRAGRPRESETGRCEDIWED